MAPIQACRNAGTHISGHTCTHAHAHTYTHACTYACACAHTHVRMRTRICACTHACTQAHAQVCICGHPWRHLRVRVGQAHMRAQACSWRACRRASVYVRRHLQVHRRGTITHSLAFTNRCTCGDSWQVSTEMTQKLLQMTQKLLDDADQKKDTSPIVSGVHVHTHTCASARIPFRLHTYSPTSVLVRGDVKAGGPHPNQVRL